MLASTMSARRLDPAALPADSPLAKTLAARGSGKPVLLEYDGSTVHAREGEPLALALLAAGRRVISRSVKFHRPRGALCLRGACDGCLLRVDGVANTMSCTVPVHSGSNALSQNSFPSAALDVFRVTDWFFPKQFDHHHLMVQFGTALNRTMQGFARRMAGLGSLPDRDGPTPEPERIACDVLVVGAGPAGLAVATRLAQSGRRVLLCEEEHEAGGTLRDELALTDGVTGHERAEALEREATSVGVVLRRSSGVVASYDNGTLALGPERALWIEPRARVFACGGHEGVGLFAGNERPGVMTARAVARALRWGVLPGTSVVLAGTAWPAEPVAQALASAGVAAQRVGADEVLEASGGRELRGVRLEGKRSLRAEVLAVALDPVPAYELLGQCGVMANPREGAEGFWPELQSDGSSAREGVFGAGLCVLGAGADWAAVAAHGAAVAARVERFLAGEGP